MESLDCVQNMFGELATKSYPEHQREQHGQKTPQLHTYFLHYWS